MLKDCLFRFRGRRFAGLPAAVCAAFGAVSAIAFGGAMVAPTVADAATTNVAQFHTFNDNDSTTVADAAHYQIVQLQYSSTVKTLVDAIHANDPGVKVLMYSDPTDAGTGQSGTDGWTTCTTSTQDSAAGNAWNLYDGSTQISGQMNMGNASYDAACVNSAMALAKSADFDGVFWDEINAVPGYAISQTCINAYQAASCSLYNGGSQSAWQDNTYHLIQAIGTADSTNGMMSILNIGGTYNQPAVWQQWNGPVSGAMEESFVGSYLGTSVPYAEWQGELANEQWSEANGKYEMAVHYDPSQNQESLDTYGLASMLLDAGGMTSFSSEATTPTTAPYDFWPEYTAAQNLGAPSGAYTTVTSAGATVYERKFANGIVVVNPTMSASALVSLGGTYDGSGNEPASVSSVTLPAQSGLILTTAPSSSSTSSGSSGSGSGVGSSPPTTVSLPKQGSLPKLSCTTAIKQKKLILTCTTKGSSKVSTSLRVRAYHAGHSIANHAATVRNHHATFAVKLSKPRTGKYRLVVSIHAGGKVRDLTWSVRIRG